MNRRKSSMALKIKWNDDRVRGATTAILLLGRERLARGETADLIATALAEYREDPAAYKINKAHWPDAKELGPLKNPVHVATYRTLQGAIERLYPKMQQAKLQFNSLLELDNWLVATLKNVR
jgi:hypothetical protein